MFTVIYYIFNIFLVIFVQHVKVMINVSVLRQHSDNDFVIYFHLLDKLKVLHSLYLEALLRTILGSFRFLNKNCLEFTF